MRSTSPASGRTTIAPRATAGASTSSAACRRCARWAETGCSSPESPALGGYGYEIDGRLFNEDTLKFYEVLIGMERGGVLAPLRSADRPVVCEVGPGWAGFAYQFKTLFPRATYVLVDFPELFLFSATYLSAVFPDARLHWVTEPSPAALEGWRDADFVFVPNTSTHLLEALPLDLMVNMVSFQEMTDAQVRGYADTRRARGLSGTLQPQPGAVPVQHRAGQRA